MKKTMWLIQCFREHYYLASSLLIFLSFPSYDVWFLKGFPAFAWLSLVPLLMWLREKPMRTVISVSFLTGLIGYFLTYKWTGAFGAKVPGGSIVTLGFLIPSLTVIFASKMVLAEFLSRRFPRLRIIIFPASVLLFDGVQSIGFLAFPFTYIGYSQYPFTPFIQAASVIGVFGISAIIIMVNTAIADFAFAMMRDRRTLRQSLAPRYSGRVIAAVSIVAFCSIVGAIILNNTDRPGKRDMRVAMVQSVISPWESWHKNRYRYLMTTEYLTLQAMVQEPDFMIWSEFATLENISFNYRTSSLDPFERKVLSIAEYIKKPLMTGEIGITDDYVNRRRDYHNSAVLVNERGEVTATYPKVHLVPFGEWFPYGRWMPFLQGILNSFGASSFVPGTGPVLWTVQNRKVAPIICYEGIFFRLCRAYRNLGADFFVNITNDGWTDAYAGHFQTFAASVFRSIENGIWYVRAGNTGYTALIDPYGRIVASIPIMKKNYLVADMDFSMNHATVYSRVGDLALYLSMLFIAVLAGVMVAGRLRRKTARIAG